MGMGGGVILYRKNYEDSKLVNANFTLPDDMNLIDFHILTFKLAGSANTRKSVIFTLYPGVVEKDSSTLLYASNVQAVLVRSATSCAIQLYRLEMFYMSDITPKIIQVNGLLAEQIMFKADGTFERLSMTDNISNSRLIEVIGWLKP